MITIAVGCEIWGRATEGGKAGVEVGAVLGLEGVKPAAAGEDPVACNAAAVLMGEWVRNSGTSSKIAVML